MTCFFDVGQKPLVFIVTMHIDLVFVMVDVALVSMWGIEVELISALELN